MEYALAYYRDFVRPAKQYKFMVIASPAGNYFKSGSPAVSIWVSDYTRAAPGGTGAAKCGGNYAASLVPTGQAFAKGHDQVLFLDAVERKWVEELGGMNLFFVFADRHDHPWRKRIDPQAFDLGSGDRALVRGGKIHPSYRIMVPEDFVKPEVGSGA